MEDKEEGSRSTFRNPSLILKTPNCETFCKLLLTSLDANVAYVIYNKLALLMSTGGGPPSCAKISLSGKLSECQCLLQGA
jgi:hypothetical protein